MKFEFIIIIVTGFLIFNTYHDGKYLKILKSWKKYYQMAFIGFLGLSLFIFIKKKPGQIKPLLRHATDLIKYMPIDKNSTEFINPLMKISSSSFISGGNDDKEYQMEQRIINSGYNNNKKRSVSETKKKFVASNQNWKCKLCNKQLNAWFEVDHTISLENGGNNSVENLRALCRECHGKKTAFEKFN